ncbi:MAG TPA: class I SAM-dependent methyltransferase [Anaerolineales bacterium]|nr:class I SAM-dependent methyltransferase [Anaerolineales bacterium]
MDSATAARLIELNREFYTHFGGSFSATRQRIQPGVRRVLDLLHGDEKILDLGCGNGELARELARRGQRGSYLGVDFSLPLLREAESPPAEASQPGNVAAATWHNFSATFHAMDLTKLTLETTSFIPSPLSFDIVFSFATLHHIPSRDFRINLLKTIHQLLQPGGLFIHSNWQFLNSEKLKARIQPWKDVAVSGPELSGVEVSGVDAGDYLLDWRSGGKGLRYVHHFNEEELRDLAEATGFQVIDTFYSDGQTGNLGLYQVWKPSS